MRMFEKDPLGSFITVDGEGRPHARGFMVAGIEDGKLHFFTSNRKEVFKQLAENPNVAFNVVAGRTSVCVEGRAERVSDIGAKERLFNEVVRSIYGSPDNPELELVCIATGKLRLFDMSVRPPRIEDHEF